MHGRRLWRTRDSPLVSVLSPKCAHSQKTENTLSHSLSKAQTDLPSPNRRLISPPHHSRPPAQIVIPRILPSKKSNRSSMTSRLSRRFETSLHSGSFTNTTYFETRIQNNSSMQVYIPSSISDSVPRHYGPCNLRNLPTLIRPRQECAGSSSRVHPPV